MYFIIYCILADNGCTSQRYGEISKQRLDRAILTFFQHFRKSYVGDQAMHSSKVISFPFAYIYIYTEAQKFFWYKNALFR